MKIIVDTTKDSAKDIKKAISLLQGILTDSDASQLISKRELNDDFEDNASIKKITPTNNNIKKQSGSSKPVDASIDEDLGLKVY